MNLLIIIAITKPNIEIKDIPQECMEYFENDFLQEVIIPP